MHWAIRMAWIVGALAAISVAGLALTARTWGPCGPSSPWPIIFWLSAIGCGFLTAVFLVISFFAEQ